jgi:hypothetical protein
MTRFALLFVALSFVCWASLASSHAWGQYAAGLVSYNPGATPASGFTTPTSALGSPERLTGEGSFPGVVSPFNPPFLSSEIVSVGEGGHIILRLSHYAIPQAAGPEIGVFENLGLIDTNYPSGVAGSPAMAFGIDTASVDVSADGANWVSLGDVTFDIPANGYADLTEPFAGVAGNMPSDFQEPFTGSLSSFDGLPYFDAGGPDMRELLTGSGGGKWLDISGAGLPQVGFIRFSVADDFNSGSQLNFELDAVSISRAAMGAVVVPEPTFSLLLGFASLAFASLAARSTARNFRG